MNTEYFIARRVATAGQQSFSRLIIRVAVVAVAETDVGLAAGAGLPGTGERGRFVFQNGGDVQVRDLGQIVDAVDRERDRRLVALQDTGEEEATVRRTLPLSVQVAGAPYGMDGSSRVTPIASATSGMSSVLSMVPLKASAPGPAA